MHHEPPADPSARRGRLRDVKIMMAIYESVRTGKTVNLV